MSSIRIILDNTGGVTTQFVDRTNTGFAYHTHSADHATTNIRTFLEDDACYDWEGLDEDAVALEPTDEQIASGQYRVYVIAGENLLSEASGPLKEMVKDGWPAGVTIATGLRDLLGLSI